MTRSLGLPLLAGVMLVCIAAAGLSGCARSDKKQIAGIVFQEDQFFRLVTFGMREAAAKNGVELLEANTAGKPDKEIQLVNTYIASGVDAIVISPLSLTASSSALGRAREKGIAVITYNTNVEGDIAAAYIESDQYGLGALTGTAAREYIEAKLGGNARIGILAFMSNAPEQNIARVSGFKDQLASLPGVTIVAEQDAWLAETAVKKGSDILTAHPDLNILWAANEGGTVGCVMAVKNSGRTGKVVVFGTDASEQLADFLLADDNILQAVTGQQPYDIGFQALEAAVKTLNGQPVEKKTALPGLLLSRADTAGILAFKGRLAQLTK
ncbi:MAG: sugar transporter substrate-binding protein [candidate division NC10 bacterium]|nr:sugar transporter substrate-binding protein [candidate division NC10 bacterium]